MFFFKPLEQFEVNIFFPIFLDSFLFYVPFDLSISNLNISLIFVLVIFLFFFFFSFYFNFIPSTLQILCEDLYFFLADNIENQLTFLGQKFFPFISLIFFFILFSNLLGLLPFAFALTSQMIINFSISFALLFGITFLGILNFKSKFFLLFFPSGIQAGLLPLIILIELVSYLTRGFSLAIRLFANIMAGHTLLAILSMFVIKLGKFQFFFGLSALFIIVVVLLLEVVIAFLQAYVFLILMLIYFTDGLFSSQH